MYTPLTCCRWKLTPQYTRPHSALGMELSYRRPRILCFSSREGGGGRIVCPLFSGIVIGHCANSSCCDGANQQTVCFLGALWFVDPARTGDRFFFRLQRLHTFFTQFFMCLRVKCVQKQVFGGQHAVVQQPLASQYKWKHLCLEEAGRRRSICGPTKRSGWRALHIVSVRLGV